MNVQKIARNSYFTLNFLNPQGSLLDKKLSILTWSFFRQGVLKQILTEGERLIMTIMPILTFAEQVLWSKDFFNYLKTQFSRAHKFIHFLVVLRIRVSAENYQRQSRVLTFNISFHYREHMKLLTILALWQQDSYSVQ